MRAVALLGAVALITGPAVAQTATLQQQAAQLMPIWQGYQSCALDHMRNAASARPEAPFSSQEGGIKPICGGYIQRFLTVYTQVMNGDAGGPSVIREIYTKFQPTLQATYNQAASAELARRQSVAQQSARRVEDERLDAERKKLVGDAATEHWACARKQIASLLPYSNEGAEVIATTALANCSDNEDKRVALGVGLFKLDRGIIQKIVRDHIAEMKQRLTADIVTIRAMANKATSETPRAPATGGQGGFNSAGKSY